VTVRTARLAAGRTGTANITVSAYTCPSGKTAIVKSVHATCVSGSATVLILAASSGATTINLHFGSLASGAVQSLTELYLVMEPGDEFLVNSNQTNGVTYWLSGVELEGVAP